VTLDVVAGLPEAVDTKDADTSPREPSEASVAFAMAVVEGTIVVLPMLVEVVVGVVVVVDKAVVLEMTGTMYRLGMVLADRTCETTHGQIRIRSPNLRTHRDGEAAPLL